MRDSVRDAEARTDPLVALRVALRVFVRLHEYEYSYSPKKRNRLFITISQVTDLARF